MKTKTKKENEQLTEVIPIKRIEAFKGSSKKSAKPIELTAIRKGINHVLTLLVLMTARSRPDSSRPILLAGLPASHTTSSRLTEEMSFRSQRTSLQECSGHRAVITRDMSF